MNLNTALPRSRRSSRLLGVLILSMLFIMLCASAIHAQSEDVTLQVWLPQGFFNEDQQNIVKDQIDAFQKANPGITVDLQYIVDVNGFFLNALAAGEAPPDVIMVYDGDSAHDAQSGTLLALHSYLEASDDFLKDAINANTYNGTLYGLPFVRFGCAPRYENLAVSAVSQHPDAAAKLIDYFTQPDQQIAYVGKLDQLYPTRSSLNKQLSVDCPDFEVLRPPPELLPVARQVGDELDTTLRDVLGEFHLNPSLATIYDPNGSVSESSETDTMIVLVPMKDYTEEQVQNLLPDGIFVGAVRIGKDSVAATYLKFSGDFAVSCKETQDGTACQFVSADGKTVFNVAPGDLTVYDGKYLYSDAFFTDLSITVCILGHTYVIKIG